MRIHILSALVTAALAATVACSSNSGSPSPSGDSDAGVAQDAGHDSATSQPHEAGPPEEVSVQCGTTGVPCNGPSDCCAGFSCSTTQLCSAGGPGPGPGPGWKSVVGHIGFFAYTHDDTMWSSTFVGDQTLRSVACVGPYVGWVAGDGGRIGHTVDGGSTWSSQASPFTGTLRSIHFGTSSFGAVAGDGGALAITTNGGATWRPTSLGAVNLHGARVAPGYAAGLVLAVGDGGLVYRSTDSGATFSVSTIPGAGDLRGVAADFSAHLVLAVDGAGAVWTSTDGAQSWHVEAHAGAALESISLADDLHAAIAAGATGTVLQRDASGAWTTRNVGSSADLHAALFSEDGIELVGGERGTLLYSEDQGSTWRVRDLHTTEALYGIDDL